jgi:pimeloyl-ACP methyl ester carboxylesterase
MWGLTERQAALAVLIAQGYQRTAAASYLQISQAVLKKEMSALYGSLGINSAIQLSVRLACLRFQKKFESSDSIFGEIHDQDDETLQFEYDDTGRRIAYSDYGPRDGFPVFFVHSSMTSRYVPRALRRSLRSRGFRVISIDRPGFGHTSKAIWGQFEQAAKDFCLVQDRLRVKPAHAVARGGAQFLLALAGQRPDALSGVVVINPDPVSNKSLKTVGPLGAVKEYFIRSPFMIQAFARITSKYLTPDRLNRWMEKSFESSASDSKVIKSIEVREDYWRSVKGFCAGSIDGYVAEQVEMATRSDINCPESKFLWSFMIGADDVLHDSYDNSEYWRHLVPGSQVKIIENSGRLLAFSHPEIVTEHLENIHSNLFSKSY